MENKTKTEKKTEDETTKTNLDKFKKQFFMQEVECKEVEVLLTSRKTQVVLHLVDGREATQKLTVETTNIEKGAFGLNVKKINQRKVEEDELSDKVPEIYVLIQDEITKSKEGKVPLTICYFQSALEFDDGEIKKYYTMFDKHVDVLICPLIHNEGTKEYEDRLSKQVELKNSYEDRNKKRAPV